MSAENNSTQDKSTGEKSTQTPKHDRIDKCFACGRMRPIRIGHSLWGPATMHYCDECIERRAEDEDIIRAVLGLEGSTELPKTYPGYHAVHFTKTSIEYIPLF